MEAIKILKMIFSHRKMLGTTTLLELKKKYSGSLFGFTWSILYPLLFLSVYLFLYLVVFSVKYKHFNTLESIIYIFSGLVPYIAFMESLNTNVQVIKSNMHLIKNLILPVEMIPIRVVSVALFTQFVGLIMIFILVTINGSFTWHLLLLPFALLIQTFFLLGISLFIAPLGVLLPDTSYFVNLFTLLLLFISPIGFMSFMLPRKLQFVVDANPITYLIQPFRETFLPNMTIQPYIWIVACIGSIMLFIIGCGFFSKFKNFLADYE